MVTKEDVTKTLKELGVPVSLQGFAYLRSGIMLLLEQPEAIKQTSKVLYPAIAKECDSKAIRVERSIRHAIEVSLDRGNSNLFNSIFGYSFSATKGKPTNKEYIATVVDWLANGGRV